MTTQTGVDAQDRLGRLSASRGRYALLALVPVLSVFFAADLSFYPLFGKWYGAELKSCLPQSTGLTGVDDAADRMQAFSRCRVPAELWRLMFDLGSGTLIALVATLGLLYWLPRQLYRRSGRMRVAGKPWQDAAADAVRSMGGRARPMVMIASDCREAFTVRIGKQHRIVLPRAVVTLPPEHASAVLRHECAHVVAGDVNRVWLTRAIWLASPLLLVLPVVLDIIRVRALPDRAVADLLFQWFWPFYLLRSALLLGLLWLVAQSVLRSREHEADLLASRTAEDKAVLRTLFASERATSQSSWTARLKRFVMMHPSAARRLATVENATAGLPVRAVDGLAFGALAASAIPAASYFTRPLVAGLGQPQLTTFLAALVPGALLATAWGTVSWNAPHVVSWRQRALIALGLPAGALVGFFLSPATFVTLGSDGIVFTLELWFLAAFVLAGASAISGIVGRQLQDVPVPGAQWWARATIAAVWVGAVALLEPIVSTAKAFGGTAGLLVAAATPSWALLAGQALVVVVATWHGRRYRGHAVVAGLAVAVVCTAARLMTVEPATQSNSLDRTVADVLIAAGAGLFIAGTLTMLLRTGFGLAMASGWAVTTVVGAVLAAARFSSATEAVRFCILPALNLLAIGLLVLGALLVPPPSDRRQQLSSSRC